jgi:hypothetical protein
MYVVLRQGILIPHAPSSYPMHLSPVFQENNNFCVVVRAVADHIYARSSTSITANKRGDE